MLRSSTKGSLMTRMLRLAIGLCVAALVTLGVAGVASAQTPPAYTPAISGANGHTVTGSGFTPGTTVTVTLGSQVLGEVLVAANGTFSLPFTPPTACGTYTLTATNGTQTTTSTITVQCASGVTPAGVLPKTGSNSSLPLTEVGAGLVAIGALVVFGVRQRQHHLTKVG
jgi:LPXTG-motif cell wall-anchored protein